MAAAELLPRGAAGVRLAGARRRIGYATDRRGPLLTDALPAARRNRAPAARLRRAARRARHRARRGSAPAPAARARPRAAPRPPLAAAGLDGGEARRALSRQRVRGTKRWPAERYAALADALAGRGLPCVVLIGPGERELGARVAASARAALPVLGADLDPVELAAVLARARCAVTNDSGPMHLAGAVGTPVVAFFGATDPGRTGPSGSPSRVLDRYVFCSPCFKTECPYGHECMREIGVEAQCGGAGAGGRQEPERGVRTRALTARLPPATSAPYSSTRGRGSCATPDGGGSSRTGRPDASAASSAASIRRSEASCGVRLPLRTLQERQAHTTFSQEELPPRESGITWSSDSSEDGELVPAVLAAVAVAQVDVVARELHVLPRQPVEVLQRDDARHPDRHGRRQHDLVLRLHGDVAPVLELVGRVVRQDRLDVPLVEEGKGLPHGRHLDGLEDAIQDEDL